MKSADTPGRLAEGELKLIHTGRRYRLFRDVREGLGFVLKRLDLTENDARAISSLRHEFEILNSVDVPGVVKAHEISAAEGRLTLVLEDAGEVNLGERVKTEIPSIAEFLEIAIQLTEIVSRLHQARIIHRNISPFTAVWNSKSRRVTLVNFAMATTLSSLAVESTSPSQMEGMLSYMSPEQTGRTGRTVDSRADLYSLGATFYELLTGVPPFQTHEPVELIHSHLAKRPQAPHEKNHAVPTALSNIVLKLLEKEPEQRYQTADGLLADLREAETQWASGKTIHAFPLASRDVPAGLKIPEKLYGRGAEIQALQDAFKRAGEGHRQFVLVTGAPGIGKSALVNQFAHWVIERGGSFVSGKFDQLQRGVPYTGLAQAFRMLVRQILAEPEASLARWKEEIRKATSPNGQVLIGLLPELERVIGPQPAVPELGPVEAQNRLNLVFTAFLRVFTQREHPFVIFLDDLQWVDSASLRLVEQWLVDPDNHRFLLVAAYRDLELPATHPLAISLRNLREEGVQAPEVHLGPLSQDDVALLLAETFNQEQDHSSALAKIVTKKTGGNPFFVRRLLHTLHGEKMIRFEPESRAWEWDSAEIERAPIADNVLDLMLRSIATLPENTKTLLKAGACIGYRFDLATLSEVTGHSRTNSANELWPALEDGLLLPIRDTYKTPRSAGPADPDLSALPGVVQFAHDRVQQAAYSLLSEDERRSLHLSIGRQLFLNASRAKSEGKSDGTLEDRLFDIVDQLDFGEALVTDTEEHRQLAELNLAAGLKAKLSAAYQAAYNYTTIGMRHLPLRPWEEASDLTFSLHRELAECAYLTSRHEEADQLIETAISHAPSKIAKMELYSLRVTAECVAGDFARALRTGREGLSLFGLAWPLDQLAEATETEAGAVMKNLAARDIQTLVEEAEVRDDETRACIKLLAMLGPPAYFSDAQVLAFVVTRITNLSLLHGPSAYSAYGYTFYGALHNLRTGDYETGYAFGRAGLALARRFGNRGEEARSVQVYGLIVHPWKAPIRASIPLMREGCRAALEAGELQYVALTQVAILINGFPLGTLLSEFEKDVETSLTTSKKYRNKVGGEFSLVYRQAVRCLTGRTKNPPRFDDDGFTEAAFLEEAKEHPTPLAFYWVIRLQVQYLLGDFSGAKESAARAAKVLPQAMGMIIEAEYVFYLALATTAVYRTTSDKRLLEDLYSLHSKIASWAKHCPENFHHKEQLVAAEISNVTGKSEEAAKFYRESLKQARREQFHQDEALCAELFGKFLLKEGDIAAEFYLHKALEGYRKWGATAKVRLLSETHPGILTAAGAPAPAFNSATTIDSLSLIKASQAISAERAPEDLFKRFLQIVIEVAGAESGALLLCEREDLVLRGRIRTNENIADLARVPLLAAQNLPRAIIQYAARIREPIVLVDAAREGMFASDSQVQQLGLRSVLCVPLIRLADVTGVLYLDNRAMTAAFTQERVEVVRILAAQAAISLENTAFLDALRDARDQALAASRAKDAFLAALSHELRTPLNPVLLIASDGAANETLHPALRKDFETIRNNVELEARLIDDLLDLSRITRGKLSLNNEIVDLHGIIEEAISHVRIDLQEKQIDLNLDLGANPSTVKGDPIRLQQIIWNMLKNAAKFTPEGGRITIGTSHQNEKLKITVTDTGIGLTKDELIRIFEPFSQGDHATHHTHRFGGLGLGLAISRQLVELHHGKIRAESEGRGKGATFIIELPTAA